MPTLVVDGPPADAGVRCGTGSGFTLAAAVLGFFVITLDAVVVNVALPAVRGELGGGISGLQWVVDAYTLMFAALLLCPGHCPTGSAPAVRSVPGCWCSSPPPWPAGWRRPSMRWSPPGSSRVRRPQR